MAALLHTLTKDNGAAFQICRQLDPVQLQDLGLACHELERICEGVFWAEYSEASLWDADDTPSRKVYA